MDGPGEKHVTATARPMSQSAKIAAMQNGNYELFDWRQSNQSLNQEYIEIISRFFTWTSKSISRIRLRKIQLCLTLAMAIYNLRGQLFRK